ncbi:MAG: hypothetical protein QXM31_01535 [Candidatus Woesearchaeota archaeon]
MSNAKENYELTEKDLPNDLANILDIANFVNLFHKHYSLDDNSEFMKCLDRFMKEKKKNLEKATLSELRAHLFFQLRLAVHSGREHSIYADPEEVKKVFAAVREKIRDKQFD